LKKKTILTFQDREGNLASSAFRVVGIYKTGNGPYDDGNVFVNIKDVAVLSGLKDNFNEIAILLKSNKLLNQISSYYKKKFPDVSIQNWMEISPELGMIVSFGGQMVYIFMGIILLSLAFGIVNTMMMSVLERTYEIGMLMALGMTRIKIFIMIVLETFFLIMIGSPIGMLLAFLTIAITHHSGIVLKSLDEVYSSFGFKPVIYPELSWSQFRSIVLLVIVTAFLSSLLPARKAIKLKLAETLKK
jgi:ABC-type lipoprotein release transport system permease subunit